MAEAKPIRFAVYTRNSSKEGLEKTPNSLDAQRETCEACILSQKHAGRMLVPTAYDDGGFSGISMARPALQALLADVVSGPAAACRIKFRRRSSRWARPTAMPWECWYRPEALT